MLRCSLFLALCLPALAGDPSRLSDLIERGPAGRRELLEEVRLAKERNDTNGAYPLAEALVALADGRALEASEYAARAAAAPAVDFGDRDAAREALALGGEPPKRAHRSQETRELLEFLVAWGEEWEWRSRRPLAKTAYATAAGLASKLLAATTDMGEALALANIEYRAHHRLAGLALRSGDDAGFKSAALRANEAHASRTALAAAPAPATRESWMAVVDAGPLAAVGECPEPPDHPVKAMEEASRLFAGKAPSGVLVLALGDRYGERPLSLRWDAAMALIPHARQTAPAIKRWVKSAADPGPGLALLSLAGEEVDAGSDLADPWRARACENEEALQKAFETLPRGRRLAVAFRLRDLRGEDEVDLGR